MAKPPSKPPLALVSGAAGEIESIATPLRPLGHHGQRLWSLTQSEYGISDIGGREILTQICELLDRAEELRETINRDGAVIRTKSGPKLHPGVREETSIRVAITKNLERLGLNLEPIRSPGGQPRSIGWTGER
jgi:hypothetical protein